MNLQEKIRYYFKGNINEVDVISPRKDAGKSTNRKELGKSKSKYSKEIKYKSPGSKKAMRRRPKRVYNNKTADARNILASKHGIKRAQKKIDNAYVMDYEEIGTLMRKFGYDFSEEGQWRKKVIGDDEDGKGKKDPDSTPSVKDKQEDTPIYRKDGGDVIDPFTGDQISVPTVGGKEDDIETGLWVYGLDALGEQILEEEIMSFEARLIFFIIFQKPEAVEFEPNDEVKEGEIPVISREVILSKVNEVNYYWDRYRQAWVDENGNFPVAGEMDESEKSISGRAFACAYWDDYDYLKEEGGEFLIDRDTVYENLQEVGFEWDEIGKAWDLPITDS